MSKSKAEKTRALHSEFFTGNDTAVKLKRICSLASPIPEAHTADR
jgi:hypothetical protein